MKNDASQQINHENNGIMFNDSETDNKNETLDLLKQSYESIKILKLENNEFKQQLEKYKNEISQLKGNSDSVSRILFYDYGTLINHNDEWNENYVSMTRSMDFTLVIPKSGKWFEPVKNRNNFFLPSKFRVDLELIEYNPTLRIFLLNKKGETVDIEVGYYEKSGGKGHLTLTYYNGDVKLYINEDEIINKRMNLGDDGIGIRFDMWAGDKFKFKEFIIQENLKCTRHDSKVRFCPICGNFSEFTPVGNSEFCPVCKSLERHRFVYFLFKKQFNDLLFHQNIKFLHFAPENCFYDFFNDKPNIDYYPVDLNPENYAVKIRDKVNMESISYASDTFDVIYQCHVLEHVPNDVVAMSELYRVLKPGGYCIILVPINFSLRETLEKKEYNTPELREKYYGQHDHVRYYAMDIINKLKSVGFNVNPIFSEELFDFDSEMELYKIAHDVAFICKK